MLTRISDDEDYRFEFDPEWLEDPGRLMLGQQFELCRPSVIESSGLPLWFAHLLPQGPWRRHLQRTAGLEPDEEDDFALLVALGGDLPGAVTLHATWRGPLAEETPRSRPVPGRYRAVLAGAQAKISVKPGEYSGVVLPVQGEAGPTIWKLHNPEYPQAVAVEFATMSWALASGLDVPPFGLADVALLDELPGDLPTGDGRAFSIARFDRVARHRIHMEDLAQVVARRPGTGPGGQYDAPIEGLGAVVARLCPESATEFVRRVVFNVLAGNGDAHLKNWSMTYPDGRTATLSPCYDLVSTVVWGDRCMALTMAGTDTYGGVTVGSFDGLGRALDIGPTDMRRLVIESAERVLRAWRNGAAELGYSADHIVALERHLESVPMVRELGV